MKRIVSYLISFILVIVLVGCDGNTKKHEGESKTPSGSSIQKGRNYQDVIDDFEEKGFLNIKTEELKDLVTGWLTKDGEVECVSVDGNKEYSPDVWYPNNIEVVITYHTFQKDGNSTSTATNGGNDKVETKAETKNDILTIKNNEDMAALFKVSDFDPFISKFAKKYSGRNIQFDGYIAKMTPYKDYKTRYDLLIYTGNYGESSGNALSFKFENINIVSDLKLTGSNIPVNISEGQNLRIVAQVEEYKEVSGLFFLKPVSTEIR